MGNLKIIQDYLCSFKSQVFEVSHISVSIIIYSLLGLFCDKRYNIILLMDGAGFNISKCISDHIPANLRLAAQPSSSGVYGSPFHFR